VEGETVGASAWAGVNFAAARQNFERNYFSSQYNSCDGNISEISRRTGVDRKQLYKKLYEYGIARKMDSANTIMIGGK
jgi:DNA-binding NtrC family response regulator